MLSCPLCQSSLSRQAKRWICTNGHSFDMAKEGYCHLLPVQHKHSKMPGDNLAMIKARQAFLAQGHYHFLAEQLSEVVNRLSQPQQSLLDIGCGEGYYGHYIQQQSPHPLNYVGIDISKEAVKLAAKKAKGQGGQYFVASSQRLPLEPHSIDLCLRVFAPSNLNELQRIIKPSGYFITVRPAAEHLKQLKLHIYQDLKLHDEQAEQLPGFEHQNQYRLSHVANLSNEQVQQLCMMTPFAWRKGERLALALASANQHQMSFEFVIDYYQRQSSH